MSPGALDLEKLSDAFLLIGKELPLLANADTLAILKSLDTIREEIHRTKEMKDALELMLETKLAGVEKRLDDIESLLRGLQSSIQKNLAEDTNVGESKSSDTVKPLFTEQKPGQQVVGVSRKEIDAQGNQNLVHGPLGALLIIAFTLIPLIALVIY